MKHVSRFCSQALVLVVLTFGATADAEIYVASVSGFASDTSNPLDGAGDAAGATGNPIDMILNSADPDVGAIMDRRAAFEIDLLPLVGQPFVGAAVEFEVFTANSASPVGLFLYAGDGLLTPADYGRTQDLLFSDVLTDVTPVFDVTTYVQGLLADGERWLGVLVGMTDEDQTLAIYNVGAGGTDPRLNTKIPEPGSLLLLATLSGLALGRRRKVAPRP